MVAQKVYVSAALLGITYQGQMTFIPLKNGQVVRGYFQGNHIAKREAFEKNKWSFYCIDEGKLMELDGHDMISVQLFEGNDRLYMATDSQVTNCMHRSINPNTRYMNSVLSAYFH